MFGRGRFLWVERWVPGEGKKASECEGSEGDEARGWRKQILGEAESGAWARRMKMLWEGENGWKGSETE